MSTSFKLGNILQSRFVCKNEGENVLWDLMTSGGREKSFASWDQSAGGGGEGCSSGSFELGTSFSQDHLGLAWRTCVEYEGGMWSLVYVVA